MDGFTLVEMMVVIAIMVTLMTLVGNGVAKGVEKARVQAEIISVYGQIKKAGVHAFVSGRSLELNFDKHSMVLIDDQNNVVSQATYEYLFFNYQSISFNRNGLPDRFELKVGEGDSARILELGPLFKRTTSVDCNINGGYVTQIS